jgi:hypothetical protein
MDEEDAADLRKIVGAVVEYTVDGKKRGVSRYTVEDAETAGLIKHDKPRAAWNTSRRNMLLARAMSNGVKWFVPEVLGGLPVYTTGELEATRPQSLTAPAGDGGDEGSGIDLGPAVDEVIAKAEELGHAGLSNRAAIELALGNRAPAVVNKWVRDAKAELTKMEEERREADNPTEVDNVDTPAEEPAEEPAQMDEPADAEVVPEEEAAAEAEEAALDADPDVVSHEEESS